MQDAFCWKRECNDAVVVLDESLGMNDRGWGHNAGDRHAL